MSVSVSDSWVRRMLVDALQPGGVQARAVTSSGSDFTAPSTPLYDAVDTARPAQVLAQRCRRFPLGATGRVQLPKVLGLTAAVQAAENSSGGITPAVNDEYVAADASTVSAVLGASLQFWEQSDIEVDAWVEAAITAALDAQVEARIVDALVNNSVAPISVDGSAVTAGFGLLTAAAQAIAQSAKVRYQNPGAVICSPARAAWWLSDQSSGSGRPLANIGAQLSLVGVDLLVSGAVDDGTVVVASLAEVDVFVADGGVTAYEDAAGLAGDLSVAIEGHARVAVLPQYPEATAVVSGLPALPAGW